MGYVFDPILFSGFVPQSPSAGVPIYPNPGGFPVTAPTGSLAVATSTNELYEFNGTSWVVIGGPGAMLSVGPIDSQTPSANGAVDANNALVLQSASTTVPGLVNNATQTFSGAKTLTSALSLNSNQIHNVGDPSAAQDAMTLNYATNTYIPLTQKAAPNGVATLDASGKIPSAELPSTVLQYQGLWNPTTNTPTLQDSTGTAGFVYQVSANYLPTIAGLNNPTMVNFQTGNLIIYSGSISQWEQTTPAAGVQSVNGAQGNVTVNAINQLTGDVTAGPAVGSESQVATLTATTNSTITTLTALSLPGSQVSGNISGNAANITATSNSTLTTLSALSLPGAQVTGNISGNAGNITATSNSTLTTLPNLSLPYSQVTGTPTPGANTALSNLTTTSINQSLIPGSSLNLGSAANGWNNGFISQLVDSSSDTAISIQNRQLIDSNGHVQLYWNPSGVYIGTSGDYSTLFIWSANTGQSVGIEAPDPGTMSYEFNLPATAGTSGQYLTSQGGANNAMTWTTPTTGTVSSVSVTTANGFTGTVATPTTTPAITIETNVTGILYGNGTAISAATPVEFPTLNQNTTGTAANITASSNSTLTTLSALSLPGSQVTGNIAGNAANVTGIVGITNGGTGQTTQQAALNALAGSVTTGDFLRGNGTNVVMSAIQSADIPNNAANTTGTASNITATSNSTLTSLPDLTLPTTQLSGTLQAAQFPALTGDVTTTAGSLATSLVATSNSTLTTLSALTTASSLSSIGTITSGTWNGTTVAVAHGGTGVTSVTTTPTATSFAGWDANKNFSANSLIESVTTTATSGTTTTLTVSSTQFQQFTGTATQTVVLPNATTLADGQTYTITNRSTGNVTVNANGGGLLETMVGSSQATYTLINNTTSAGVWDVQYTQTGVIAFIQPTIQKFTSGTAQTYTTPSGVQYIRVRMVGPGGGGGGAGTGAGAGQNGSSATTFGTSLLVANAGGGGQAANGAPGTGGTASLGSGPIGTAIAGGQGEGGSQNANASGGMGGVSPFGGAGTGVPNNNAGSNAQANTGSGGGGGGSSLSAISGGGGAGGFIDAIITSPAATYTYTVGTGGNGGTAGTSGSAGGNGAAGYIEVTEYYTNYSATTTTSVAAGQVLAGPVSGANANPTFRTLTAPTFQILTSGTTYTTPAGAQLLKVTVVGGGGAGGGCSTAASAAGAGGGGGGGGTSVAWISNPTTSYTYAIGAGGTAGTAGGNPGNNGGASNFNTTIIGGGGTGGGGSGTAGSPVGSAAGGGGGSASGGSLNLAGSTGDSAFILSGTSSLAGYGGASGLGIGAGGAIGPGANSNGNPGGNYGGGGSGGAQISNGGAKSGGAGANGVIIVEEYYQ